MIHGTYVHCCRQRGATQIVVWGTQHIPQVLLLQDKAGTASSMPGCRQCEDCLHQQPRYLLPGHQLST
jgi:hypothetical protein